MGKRYRTPKRVWLCPDWDTMGGPANPQKFRADVTCEDCIEKDDCPGPAHYKMVDKKR